MNSSDKAWDEPSGGDRVANNPRPDEDRPISSIPVPTGTVLTGELTTPSHSIRTGVSLQVTERSGDAFRGILSYGRGTLVGRRGVHGTVKPDGRRLVFSAEWYQGALSPEPISYHLAMGGGDRLSGTWATPTLTGMITLR